MKRLFVRPATIHVQQVALLQQRGIVIDDHATHTFKPGTQLPHSLIAQPGVSVTAMDFPANWQNLPIWQDPIPKPGRP